MAHLWHSYWAWVGGNIGAMPLEAAIAIASAVCFRKPVARWWKKHFGDGIGDEVAALRKHIADELAEHRRHFDAQAASLHRRLDDHADLIRAAAAPTRKTTRPPAETAS